MITADTSRAARSQFVADGKDHIRYAIIREALTKIGEGTAKRMADVCELTYVQICRRLPEMTDVVDTGKRVKYGQDKTACRVYRLRD